MKPKVLAKNVRSNRARGLVRAVALLLLTMAAQLGCELDASLSVEEARTYSAALNGEVRLVLNPSADASVREYRRYRSFGGESDLPLDQDRVSRVLVEFDEAALLSGIGNSPLRAAFLELPIAANDHRWPVGAKLAAHALDRPWDELAATWTCAAETDTTNSVNDCAPSDIWNMDNPALWPFPAVPVGESAIQNGQSKRVAINVTPDVANFLAGSTDALRWVVRKSDEQGAGVARILSRESGVVKPRLVVYVGSGPLPGPPVNDQDRDQIPDAIDPCPLDAWNDEDVDLRCANVDNCASRANSTQADQDSDGLGDACDLDADGDTFTVDEGDCNDANAAVNPDGLETCDDSIDQNCDGFDQACAPTSPVLVAPALDQTVPLNMLDGTAFLYTGASPVQRGVAAGTILDERAAVVRGKTLDTAGDPLSGVVVRVLEHPELGVTASRADGAFDMAVNGGGYLIVTFAKAGYLPIQRQAMVVSKDFTVVDDVVMTALDTAVTTIDLSTISGAEEARGSVVTDAQGSRQATVLFDAGTTATKVTANGRRSPLEEISLRFTEYTVGSRGPSAMPANLPAWSEYTYAVELGVDEASGSSVEFSQPVTFYVEDFLGIGAGFDVPVGTYDRVAGVWNGSPNGRVIKIVSITSSLADVDIDGDDVADSAAALAVLGIDNTERGKLASLYSVGQRLWRAQLHHFSPLDLNFPPSSPADAADPSQPTPDPDDQEECFDIEGGSLIEVQARTLGESIPIAGTPFQLIYRSDRADGREATLDVKLTGSTIPASLQKVGLKVRVAGKTESFEFTPQTNLSTSYTWDGTDAYGREVNGPVRAVVEVTYVYPAAYIFWRCDIPGRVAWSRFLGEYCPAGTGTRVLIPAPRAEHRRVQSWNLSLGTWRATDLAGWQLDVHDTAHTSLDGILTSNGPSQMADDPATSSTIRSVLGDGDFCSGDCPEDLHADETSMGLIVGVAMDAEGALYAVDNANDRVMRVGPDDVARRFAGNGVSAFAGDGGLAIDASLREPWDIDIGADGSAFISDGGNNRIRKVDPAGVITTVAGTGVATCAASGLLAASTPLRDPSGIQVGADGSLFVVEERCDRIRRIGPDGIITTFAGGGTQTTIPAGGIEATKLSIPNLGLDIALGPDGDLYVPDLGRQYVYRISPDGILRIAAGNGTAGFSGDGGLATAANIDDPLSLAALPNGDLLVADWGNDRIRRVTANGIITTLVGGGAADYTRNDVPTGQLSAVDVFAMAAAPDGRAFYAPWSTSRILEIGRPKIVDNLVPSKDGQTIGVFDRDGRHLQTLDALTGAVRLEFGYTSSGELESIEDGHGLVTTIVRNTNGAPVAIEAPFGQTTTLTTDVNGYLDSVENPEGETFELAYKPATGLLSQFTTPGSHSYSFSYSMDGRLSQDSDPAGGFKTLDRVSTSTGYRIDVETAEGRTTSSAVTNVSGGGQERERTLRNGLVVGSTYGSDAVRSSLAPDGTATSKVLGPDPRWGMLAPIVEEETVTTPLGKERVTTRSREVSLGLDLDGRPDPLLLLTQTDTIAVNGKTTTTVYQSADRTKVTTSPAGRETTVVVDQQGRPVNLSVEGVEPIRVTYDDDGRVESVAQGAGAEERVTTYSYGTDGFLESMLDPELRETTFARDLTGRPTSILLPDSRLVDLGYDANGNTTSVTPPGESAHGLDYTPVDLLASYTPPDVLPGTDATTYDYNLDRQLELVTLPDADTISVVYDGAGRTDSVVIARGTVDYSYSSGTGQLQSIASPGPVTLSFTHDGFLPTKTTWAGAVSGDVELVPDNDFRVSSRKVNGANSVSFGYDLDSLLTSAGGMTITRDADNGLITGTSISAVSSSHTSDAFGAADVDTISVTAGALMSLGVARDKLGRIIERVETVGAVTDTYAYSYDLAGRLEDVQLNGVATASYTYDDNGNRLTGPGSETATHDAQDRLTSYGGFTYSYSDDGALASKTETATSAVTTYDYDELGNLMQVVTPSATIDYVVDGKNRRVGKKVAGVLTQGFLYQDQLRIAAELDGSGAVVAHFVYGTKANVPDLVIKSGVTYRIFADHVGSPRLVVNTTTGAIAQEMAFDEFGKVLVDTNPGFQPFGFAGGLYDSDTGLVRFGARDYDPVVGRWTAKDPIRFAGGDTNLYAYVGNDPINMIDPTGHLATFSWAAALQAFGLGTVDLSFATGVSAAGAGAAVAVGVVGGAAVVGGFVLIYCNVGDECVWGDVFSDDVSQICGEDEEPPTRESCERKAQAAGQAVYDAAIKAGWPDAVAREWAKQRKKEVLEACLNQIN
jgi:RHS repeat-associated protein